MPLKTISTHCRPVVVGGCIPQEVQGPEGNNCKDLYFAKLDRRPAKNMIYHSLESDIDVCQSESAHRKVVVRVPPHKVVESRELLGMVARWMDAAMN